MIDQINFLYDAGQLRRFHTVPVLKDQNIAAHSFNVAMLGYILYGQNEPGITFQFLMACLTHDMAEHQVGDVPAPAKRLLDPQLGLEEGALRKAWGEMEQQILHSVSLNFETFLSEEEKRRLKLLDAFEGALHCVMERRLGNQSIEVCYNNFSSYVGELLYDGFFNEGTPEANEWELCNIIRDSWVRANNER